MGSWCVTRDTLNADQYSYNKRDNPSTTQSSPMKQLQRESNFHATALNYHKILIIGDKNVGKSRLLSWLIKDMPQPHTPNIFHQVEYELPGKQAISLTAWELDPQNLQSHVGSASGIIFIYDITQPKTKIFVQKLHSIHKNNIPKIWKILFLANKLDLQMKLQAEQNHVANGLPNGTMQEEGALLTGENWHEILDKFFTKVNVIKYQNQKQMIDVKYLTDSADVFRQRNLDQQWHGMQLKRIKEMKSSLRDISGPKKYPQSHMRAKSYRETSRLLKIHKDNSQFLGRLEKIRQRSQPKSIPQLFHRSLNQVSRKKEKNRIGVANIRLRSKLIGAKSVLDHRSHLKEFEGYKKRQKLISKYRSRAAFGTSQNATHSRSNSEALEKLTFEYMKNTREEDSLEAINK